MSDNNISHTKLYIIIATYTLIIKSKKIYFLPTQDAANLMTKGKSQLVHTYYQCILVITHHEICGQQNQTAMVCTAACLQCYTWYIMVPHTIFFIVDTR